MKSFFDKLNLRPGERRLVIIVALIVFLVVNAFLVWPRFFDWGKVTNMEKAAIATRDQYQHEVDNIPKYQRRLAELEQKGAQIGSEDQALKLSTTVYQQAGLSGVTVNDYRAVLQSTTGKTNLFFDEQSATIQYLADEHSLVDFLYNLGAGGSMIRVRSMTVSPDPPHYKLQGSITFVASYRRTSPVRGATTTTPPARSVTPARPAPTPSKTATTNAVPAPKVSWWERLWPFGKKTSATASTNVPAKPHTLSRTNPAAAGLKK
jgi:hypothetical protein